MNEERRRRNLGDVLARWFILQASQGGQHRNMGPKPRHAARHLPKYAIYNLQCSLD